jgi:hypothetical protein
VAPRSLKAGAWSGRCGARNRVVERRGADAAAVEEAAEIREAIRDARRILVRRDVLAPEALRRRGGARPDRRVDLRRVDRLACEVGN